MVDEGQRGLFGDVKPTFSLGSTDTPAASKGFSFALKRSSPGSVVTSPGKDETVSKSSNMDTANVFHARPRQDRKTSSVSSLNISPEQLSECTTLKLVAVPPDLLNRQALLRHFNAFKGLQNVIVKPRLGIALVEFTNHESAQLAKAKGGVLRPGTPAVKMQWVLPQSRFPPRREGAVMPLLPELGGVGGGKSLNLSNLGRGGKNMSSKILKSDAVKTMSSYDQQIRTIRKVVKPSIVDDNAKQEIMTFSGGAIADDDAQYLERVPTRPPRPVAPVNSAMKLFTAKLDQSVVPPATIATMPPTQHGDLGSREAGSVLAPAGDGVNPQIDRVTAANLLRQLIGKHASTPSERYNVLDERDKILRRARPQKRGVGVGNCPDMCPEKERYQREYQCQVGRYEGREGVIDHMRAVKDYSRSSADQDEPLPHELRPGVVLDMTMRHLLWNIVGSHQPDDAELNPWYNFVWRRTRQIRKDMVQQQLCDPLAVSLYEKCARFHIFAAHWLSSLDVDVFDQKINTENLTKCLQSLHQQYEDLAKRGVYCETEPEFRCYEVLLNLNNTDILRKALSWAEWVRNSPAVRFALRMLLLVQENNFRQFFKRIRQATYLQACLVHRYFTQIRAAALQTMVSAYATNSEFAISDLMDLLGFESEQSCAEFCEQYGMAVRLLTNITAEESCVVWNRKQFVFPEHAPPAQRQIVLIEEKRESVPLYEILNGGSLTPLGQYVPVNSFDSTNCYTRDPVVREWLALSPQKLVSSELLPTPPDLSQLQKHPDQDLLAQMHELEKCANDILNDVCSNLIRRIVTDECAGQLTITVFLTDMAAFLKNEVQTVLIEERSLKQAADAEISRECHALIEDVVKEQIAQICRSFYREQLLLHIDDLSEKACAQLLGEVVGADVRNISEEYYARNVRGILESLRTVASNLARIKLLDFARFWRGRARKSAGRKRVLADFPAGPSTCSREDLAQKLFGPSRNSPYLKRPRLQTNFEDTQMDELASRVTAIDAALADAMQPLNVIAYLADLLMQHSRRFLVGWQQVCMFRLLVLTDRESRLSDWLRAQFHVQMRDYNVKETRLNYCTSVLWLTEWADFGRIEDSTDAFAHADAILMLLDGDVAQAKTVTLKIENALVHAGNRRVSLACLATSSQLATVTDCLDGLVDLGFLDTLVHLTLANNDALCADSKTQLLAVLKELCSSGSLEEEYIACPLSAFLGEIFLQLIVQPLCAALNIAADQDMHSFAIDFGVALMRCFQDMCESLKIFCTNQLIAPEDVVGRLSLDHCDSLNAQHFFNATECCSYINGLRDALLAMPVFEDHRDLLQALSQTFSGLPPNIYVCFPSDAVNHLEKPDVLAHIREEQIVYLPKSDDVLNGFTANCESRNDTTGELRDVSCFVDRLMFDLSHERTMCAKDEEWYLSLLQESGTEKSGSAMLPYA